MIYGSGDKLLREFAEANDRNNLKGRFIKRWFLGSKNLDILLIQLESYRYSTINICGWE
jgi:hypothetical protein